MTDYASTPAEIEKNPQARAWLKAVAMGDEHAFEFCWAWWCYEHMLDDLVDGDKDPPPTQDDVARTALWFMRVLSYNPFYLQFRDHLYAHLTSCFNRWVEGDIIKSSGHKDDRIRADVVKCGDVDLYSTVAYLRGGWEHMRRTRDMRTFDED